MIKNYLTIAFRNLMRYKAYSLINVLGLAIGLACGILILLFIRQEFSVDRFHALGDRVYKVIREERSHTQTTFGNGTSGALGSVLKETFPEVETTVRVWPWGVRAQFGERKGDFGLSLVDVNFLEVFDFPLLKGDRKAAFQMPYSAVITDDMAKRLFGDIDPMGHTFTTDSSTFPGVYTVTGVVKDPELSTIYFDMLTTTVPQVSETQKVWTSWRPTQSWRPVVTYVLLKTGHDARVLEGKMQLLLAQYMGDEIAQKNAYHLQPLHRVYLHGESDFNPGVPSPMQRIYTLALIGLILVVIACVNFTNLATARAMTRMREVGMRKVVGAHRRQLMVQFLGESLLLTGVSLLVALGLAELFLPLFNEFAQVDLRLEMGVMVTFAPLVLVLTLGVGLLAGCYPAFFLSSFHPVAVLKGGALSVMGSAVLRKVLVVFQFGVSILLVICTLVVYQQLRFMETKDMGFTRDHILMVPIFYYDFSSEPDAHKRLSARHQMVKQEFLTHPNILNASALRYDIMGFSGRPRLIWPEGDRNRERTISVNEVDDSFFETFEIPLVRGRIFSTAIPSDTSHAIILNETAVRLLGWEDDPIGKQVESPEFEGRILTVIGVVKDYHSQSLREAIGPMGFVGRWRLFYTLALRIRPEDTTQTLSFIKAQWERFVPESPFEYHFLDEYMQWLYFDERRIGKMLGVFAALAIFVACLGLFGLSAFMAQRRIKEIGVRKVLGARPSQLAMLLSREFVLLVLLANGIAWPAAYWLMYNYLSGFAYRVDLNALPFAAGAILALIIALGTVSVQAIRTARSNPVDALRDE